MELTKQTNQAVNNNNNINNINDGIINMRDNSISFQLKDWFGKHCSDKTIDINGKKITTKVANISIVKTTDGYYCKDLPQKNLNEDQIIKIMVENPKPEQIPFEKYDLKIWKESEIEGFSTSSEKGRGLSSKVPDDDAKNFELQFGEARMVQIYYKAKHVMCLLNTGDEREVDFFMRLEKRAAKKGQTNSSPFSVSFLVSAIKEGAEAVESGSKIHLALEKFNWQSYYFDGESKFGSGSCFPNDVSTIDRFDDFYVYLGDKGFHSLREVIPWPFRMGFLVNNKSGTIYPNKINKTKEEGVLELLKKSNKSKLFKNKIASKEKKKNGEKVTRRRKTPVLSEPESETDSKEDKKKKKQKIIDKIQSKLTKKKEQDDQLSEFESDSSADEEEEEKIVPISTKISQD